MFQRFLEKFNNRVARVYVDSGNQLRQLKEFDRASEKYKQALAFRLRTGVINRTTVLQNLIERKQARTYLEIGVATGANFLQIEAEKKIAVDPKFRIPGGYTSDEFIEYYEMTSDDFFETKSEILTKYGLDIVFVDGLHRYEQSLKDVLNALKFLNDSGVIVMHDCNPSSESAGHPIRSEAKKMDGWTGAWMGDVWKTIVYLRSVRPDLKVFVLNCDCGLGIIQKGVPENMLKYSEETIACLTYKELEENKMSLLNLKKPDYWNSFLLE